VKTKKPKIIIHDFSEEQLNKIRVLSDPIIFNTEENQIESSILNRKQNIDFLLESVDYITSKREFRARFNELPYKFREEGIYLIDYDNKDFPSHWFKWEKTAEENAEMKKRILKILKGLKNKFPFLEVEEADDNYWFQLLFNDFVYDKPFIDLSNLIINPLTLLPKSPLKKDEKRKFLSFYKKIEKDDPDWAMNAYIKRNSKIPYRLESVKKALKIEYPNFKSAYDDFNEWIAVKPKTQYQRLEKEEYIFSEDRSHLETLKNEFEDRNPFKHKKNELERLSDSFKKKEIKKFEKEIKEIEAEDNEPNKEKNKKINKRKKEKSKNIKEEKSPYQLWEEGLCPPFDKK
jgi:hypothetical protein